MLWQVRLFASTILTIMLVLHSHIFSFVLADCPGDADGESCLANLLNAQAHVSTDKKKVDHALERLKQQFDTITASSLENSEYAWAIVGILPSLATLLVEKYESKDWILLLCDANTEIRPRQLAIALSAVDSQPRTSNAFVGRGLVDHERVIIHHYDEPGKIVWPDCMCGIAFSRALLLDFGRKLKELTIPPNFSIDVYYELAKNLNANGNTVLANSSAFCYDSEKESPDCAVVAPVPFSGKLQQQEPEALDKEDLIIGVKTWKGNHDKRIPVLKRTWAQDSDTVLFFSDEDDPEIPTIKTGIPNTSSGHCEKLYFILHHLWKNYPNKKWYYVADDDTMLSIPRLLHVLAEYSPTGEEAMIIGERYGYGANTLKTYQYAFPTLGCGMAVSRAALDTIVSSNIRCYKQDAPDDMWIGSLMRQLNIPLVHHHGFYQNQPSTYRPEILERCPAVAFHRLQPQNPEAIYTEYLGHEL